MQGHLKVAIMGVLIKGKLNGYEIIKEIKKETGWKPSYGSLYPMLEKLENKGYIKSKKQGKKNIYSLTFKGKRTLIKIKMNKDKFVSSVKKILRVMDGLTGEDFSGTLAPMMKNLCTNYHNIAKLEPELTEFNATLFKKAKGKNIKKAKLILSKAIKELKK